MSDRFNSGASAPLLVGESKVDSLPVPETPVGITGVRAVLRERFASMSKGICRTGDPIETDINTRSVEKLVLQITAAATAAVNVEHRSTTVPLVESLVWPFVARRSLRPEVFSPKDFQRVIRCFATSAKTITRFITAANDEQTFLKYHLDSLLCRAFSDVGGENDAGVRTPLLPELPKFMTSSDGSPVPLFTGWLRKFVARSLAHRDISFFYSLQKGAKQMWPQLGVLKEEQAYAKHKNRLNGKICRVPLGDDLRTVIQRTAREIFPGAPRLPTKFMPTGSSCLQATRRSGGALSLTDSFVLDPAPTPENAILRDRQTISGPRKRAFRDALRRKVFRGASVSLSTQQNPRQPLFEKWNYHPDVGIAGSKKPAFGSSPGFRKMLQERKNSSLQQSMGTLPVLAARFDQWRQAEYTKLSKYAMRRMEPVEGGYPPGLTVKVQAIAEPSKYRLVTIGDGYVYSALQPLQGQMLSAWKMHSSSTMLHDDLTSKVSDIFAATPWEDAYWFSADYEAATDLLSKDASVTCLGQLRDYPSIDLAIASLAAGTVQYPDGSEIVQEEGQLMGHPLSFPLLCTINLAVYRCALLRYSTDAKVSEAVRQERHNFARAAWSAVLVNGDDMLFRAKLDFLKYFRAVASEAGFKFSQGKNYISKDTCMINSQTFTSTKAGKITRHGYLNLRLVKGTNVKSGDSSAEPTMIAKDLSKMVSLCPWTNCAIPAALGRWGEDWLGCDYRPNWYIPVHLGGFGLNLAYAPRDLRITRGQRLTAARFVNDPRLALYKANSVSVSTAQLAGALMNWKVVKEQYVMLPSDTEVGDDAWLARLSMMSRAILGAEGDRPCSDRKALSILNQQQDTGVCFDKGTPEYDYLEKLPEKLEKIAAKKRRAVLERNLEHRLKPMSFETLAEYWAGRVISTTAVPCPPLAGLRVKDLSGDVYRPRHVRKFQSDRRSRYLAKISPDDYSDPDGEERFYADTYRHELSKRILERYSFQNFPGRAMDEFDLQAKEDEVDYMISTLREEVVSHVGDPSQGMESHRDLSAQKKINAARGSSRYGFGMAVLSYALLWYKIARQIREADPIDWRGQGPDFDAIEARLREFELA